MARTSTRTAAAPAKTVVTTVQQALGEHRREVAWLGLFAVTLFTSVALYGWSPDDPTWLRPDLSGEAVVTNPCGPLGAHLADLLYRSVGWGAWALVAGGLAASVWGLAGRLGLTLGRAAGVVWVWLMGLAVLELSLAPDPNGLRAGGELGAWIAAALVDVVGVIGAWIALVATIVSAVSLLAGLSWRGLAHAVVARIEEEAPAVRERAMAAGGTVGGWARAGLAAAWRMVVAGIVWIGHRVLGAGRRLLDVLRDAFHRARAAASRTVVDDDDSWHEMTGLTRPASSLGSYPSVLEPVAEGPATVVQSGTTPFAEVAWEPTRAEEEVDEVLEMFPDLGPRRVPVKGRQVARPRVTTAQPVARSAPAPTPAAADAQPGALAEAAVSLARAATALAEATPATRAPTEAPTRAGGIVMPGAHEVEPADDTPSVAPPMISDPGADEAPSVVRARAQGAPAPGAAKTPRDPADFKVEPAEGLESKGEDDGLSVSDHSNLYFELPPLALLDKVPEQRAQIDADELRELADTVEETLASFKVTGKVNNVRVGPVVTIFEFVPDPGIKVRRVANLSDDLAMALRARSVRIVAPIPGKGAVGIEIPSKHRLTIFLREMLASDEFRKTKAALPVVLGKDVEGKAIVQDLAKMPHVLVGGTTGAGKSVGVNGMLMSLLYTRTPEELRLLLIDPKKLEFEAYSDVPHLLHPVVTEAPAASAALAWACREMERRYEVLATWRTRSIDNFNKKLERELRSWNAEKAWKYAPDDYDGDKPPPPPEPMPYIVIVIDELADLMMVAKKDVEGSIVRLAQMARACGMHMILATQRPSVDVVTGLIKSNMPTRMAFKLRSVVDSRTILDQGGAEKLLGRGDMLHLPGAGEVRRVHGAFVSDDEVVRVIDFLKDQRAPAYIEGVTVDPSGGDDDDSSYDAEVEDELYDDAVNLVAEKGKASTSMIQRHLRIGYNRAARLIDAMEAAGVVGPADGARPREVLISPTPG